MKRCYVTYEQSAAPRHIPEDSSFYMFLSTTAEEYGSGSSVGIATEYELDSPGSNPGGDEIFRPSRPAQGPTQLPVKWVPCLFRGLNAAGACCDHSPPSTAVVMEEQSYISTHPLGHTGPVTGSLYLYLYCRRIKISGPREGHTKRNRTRTILLVTYLDLGSKLSSGLSFAFLGVTVKLNLPKAIRRTVGSAA